MTPTLIIAVLGSMGIGGLFTALVKGFPERNKIIVDSANDLVLVQRDVIEELRTELARLRGQHEDCERVTSELRARVAALEGAT